jgi:hypothetical protein
MIIVFIFASLFTGCSAKQGPMGPSGPGGPGVQTTHTLDVLAASTSASYQITAPEIKVDPGCDCSSVVVCYAVFFSAGGAEEPIPMTKVEPDGTKTLYQVEVRTGKVTISWKNSGSTVPSVNQFVVTVLNKQ